MSEKMAREFVDRAYASNDKSTAFYEKCIWTHIGLTVIFALIAILLNNKIGWIEVYAVPALGYFTVAHRKVALSNSEILRGAADALRARNEQPEMARNFRREKESKKQKGG